MLADNDMLFDILKYSLYFLLGLGAIFVAGIYSTLTPMVLNLNLFYGQNVSQLYFLNGLIHFGYMILMMGFFYPIILPGYVFFDRKLSETYPRIIKITTGVIAIILFLSANFFVGFSGRIFTIGFAILPDSYHLSTGCLTNNSINVTCMLSGVVSLAAIDTLLIIASMFILIILLLKRKYSTEKIIVSQNYELVEVTTN